MATKPRGRFHRPRKPQAWVYALVALAVLAAARWWNTRPAPAPPAAAPQTVAVRRVVDGDTLLLESGERVRLQGIDTPETVKEDTPIEPWGPEASQFTKDFTRGGRVRLEFDRERRDQYGRLLAFVWVDERMLNEELLRQGLARYEAHYDYAESKKIRFRAAQDEARRAKRGIWSAPRGR